MIWGSLLVTLGQQQRGWTQESPQIIKIPKLWPFSHTANPARVIPGSDISSLGYQECVCITAGIEGILKPPSNVDFLPLCFYQGRKAAAAEPQACECSGDPAGE